VSQNMAKIGRLSCCMGCPSSRNCSCKPLSKSPSYSRSLYRLFYCIHAQKRLTVHHMLI